MTAQTVRSLVLRTASFAGVRATGMGCNGRFAVMGDNPMQALSMPRRHYPMQAGSEPAEDRRGYSTDTLGRRAGRLAGSTGAAGRTPATRLPRVANPSGWSRKRIAIRVCG